MKTFPFILITAFYWLILLCCSPQAGAEDTNYIWNKYIWQIHTTTDINAAADQLIFQLRQEIQKVLDAGPLAPIRTVYADLEQDPYFMYWQGGRIIQTLAMAWPHLNESQRTAVKKYVQAELLNANRAPWTPKGYIPPDQGARREYHNYHQARGWDRYWGMWGRHKPIMGSIYGIWLYAHQSKDWDTVKQCYPQLTNLYSRRINECNLYGTMGAHIALARIAKRFQDSIMLQNTLSNASMAFSNGLQLARMDIECQKYWKERYEPRQRNQVYQGWMFLELCPEIGRYLEDNLKDAVVQRHQEAFKKYPLFWLYQAPYWTRWTGDEGIGVPTELMGMIIPIERWVAHSSAERFTSYTRSVPICVGDCYWLEMLVDAIESYGKTEWIDLEN